MEIFSIIILPAMKIIPNIGLESRKIGKYEFEFSFLSGYLITMKDIIILNEKQTKYLDRG